MGSGKSLLVAELVACARARGRIVITTSTVALVEQLGRTLSERLTVDGRQDHVGLYYTHGKQVDRPIIVACTPSAEVLVSALRERGETCAFWLADECHRTEASSMRAAMNELRPRAALGFSATPYRAYEWEALSLFETVAYRYGPADALRDGVIVPWRVQDWTGDQVPLDDACCEMIAGSEGPGIVNAVSIRDAERFARRLKRGGIAAAAVHSEMPRSRLSARLQALQAGRIRALVHVALLQEGVDLPWLRWICLRRPLSSRVRFAQEVGRVLRAHPGKRVAVIYDPLDLCSVFRLTYEATLGWETPHARLDPRAADETEGWYELARLIAARTAPPVTALTEIESRLKALVIHFDQAGLLENIWPAGHWRTKLAHPLQLTEIARRRHLLGYPIGPHPERQFLRALAKHAHLLTRGGAADLLALAIALDRHRRWPDPVDPDAGARPPEEAAA